MARITAEDCLSHVSNRFVLTLVAAKRARQLEKGADQPKVPVKDDKNPVIALREIATGALDAQLKKANELIEQIALKKNPVSGEVGEVI